MKVPYVFMALDVDTKEEAFALAEAWAGRVYGFKVGPRLGFLFHEKDWLKLSKFGEVFLDYKFFDIPSTVLSSVKRAADLGVKYCTVHALNGVQCLEGLSRFAEESHSDINILAVTLLTSFDRKTNPFPLEDQKENDEIVESLSQTVFSSGLKGLVCSAHESSALKEKESESILVCPGVRFPWDQKDDQKRVMTPKEAFENKADFLVMGRSLLRAKTDVEISKVEENLKEAMKYHV